MLVGILMYYTLINTIDILLLSKIMTERFILENNALYPLEDVVHQQQLHHCGSSSYKSWSRLLECSAHLMWQSAFQLFIC
jgi:hypothetical protein